MDSDPNLAEFPCPKCGVIQNLVVKIQGGKITAVLALSDNELETKLGLAGTKTDIVIIREDGSIWPRYDWDDAPLS